MECDVAIIGGGPAGTTAGTLLKKYNPSLRVALFEQEVFPREHIGESQLPGISTILDEMGAWDKVEAANFPIKIGSTNRWGKNPELWDFEFVPSEQFDNSPRPGRFEGIRRHTAFQVDRSVYDKILLDHTAEAGVEVREGIRVTKIHKTGDRIDSLELASGERVNAKYYADATGHVGLVRRAMGVGTDFPTSLQNVAFWDYWQDADWAVSIGNGGTKIQVMSLGYGWLWFIPVGPTRTSIGLVLPAKYFKQCGKRPEELYIEAVQSEERIAGLVKNAAREHKFATTKDWSFLAERHNGENWFLIGESGGFADPILSAGMTIAHAAGREFAYTILELERGQHDAAWLKREFDKRQSQRVRSHIRFADFWYLCNSQFSDLKEHTQEIAREAGLELTPDAAWRWIAQGGFVDEELSFGLGAFSLNAIKAVGTVLADINTKSPFDDNNVYELELDGAMHKDSAVFRQGTIAVRRSFERDGRVLPLDGECKVIYDVLLRTNDLVSIVDMFQRMIANHTTNHQVRQHNLLKVFEAFEAMISDGWIKASHNPKRPRLKIGRQDYAIRLNKDTLVPQA